jgi:polyhydroxyalkanoate synthesis repressor PhaR
METVTPENPEAEAVHAPAKVIKRYANRKLYDTGDSRYVTLEEIGEMVKQGLEVAVVDNRSKRDLTAVTLAQIIFEEEKKRNRMPLAMLRDIIRNGGETISGFIQREVQPRLSSMQKTMSAFPQFARELQQIAGRLDEIERRIEHLTEAPDTEPGALPQSVDTGGMPEKHESH